MAYYCVDIASQLRCTVGNSGGALKVKGSSALDLSVTGANDQLRKVGHVRMSDREERQLGLGRGATNSQCRDFAQKTNA